MPDTSPLSKAAFFVVAFVAAVTLAGCPATVAKVPVQLTHPAEINMAPYRQVVIGRIKGDLARGFSEGLKEALVNSGRFKVLDRAQLGQLMGELKLSQSDLVDPKYRAKLGKLLSGAALITGHIGGKAEGKVVREILTRREEAGKDGEGKNTYREIKVEQFTRTCTATTSGSIEVVDIQTGEIVKSKTLRAISEDKAVGQGSPPACKVSDEGLLGRALGQDLQAFVRAISPWSETVQVPFAKDTRLPDLERGIRHAQMGEMIEAANIFAKTCKDADGNPSLQPAVVAKAYWNLGLSLQHARKYAMAVSAYKKAYLLSPEPRFLDGQKSARRMQEEEVDLRKQGVNK